MIFHAKNLRLRLFRPKKHRRTTKGPVEASKARETAFLLAGEAKSEDSSTLRGKVSQDFHVIGQGASYTALRSRVGGTGGCRLGAASTGPASGGRGSMER